MISFKNFIKESPASNSHEIAVAKAINSFNGVKATRPNSGTSFSDVKVTLDSGESSWVEVKMNHTDNLTNARVFFDGKKWDTTSTATSAFKTVELLNKSSEAKKFIKSLSKFTGIKNPSVPSSKGGLTNLKNAVPADLMKKFFEQPGVTRYIMQEPNINLGRIVTDHFTKSKKEPAFYIQIGDDFYMISKENPLGLPSDIPKLSGKGMFKVRISTVLSFYQVHQEVKITKLPKSKYSVLKGTTKKNPFENIS